MIVHPFVFLLFYYAWVFRSKTTFPTLQFKVDSAVAAGLVVTAVFFWLTYWLVGKLFVQKLNVFSRIRFPNSEKAFVDCKPAFYGLVAFCLIYTILAPIIRYQLIGNWQDVFLGAYALLKQKSEPLSGSWLQLARVHTVYTIVFYAVLATIFIWAHLRSSRICSSLNQIIVIFLALLWITSMFGNGQRQHIIYPLICGGLLLLTQMTTGHKFSRSIYLSFVIWFFFTFAAIFLMASTRSKGYEAIQRFFSTPNTAVVTMQGGAKETFYSLETDVYEKRNEAWEQHKELARLEHIEEMNNSLTSTVLQIDIVDTQGHQDDPTSVIAHTHTQSGQDETTVAIDDVQNEQDETTVAIDNAQKSRIECIALHAILKARPRNIPDILAKSMHYYGVEHDYYPISHFFHVFGARIIPKEFVSAEYKDTVGPYKQIMRDLGHASRKGSNYPPGCFCEGYFYGGYVSALIFCAVAGMCIGLFANIAWSMLHCHHAFRFDLLIVALVLYHCTMDFTTGTFAQSIPRLLINVLVLLVVLSFCHFANAILGRYVRSEGKSEHIQ